MCYNIYVLNNLNLKQNKNINKLSMSYKVFIGTTRLPNFRRRVLTGIRVPTIREIAP